MADAIDEFIALPRDQQLTTLQKLAPDKQDALLGEVKKRRAAPAAAPAQPSPTVGDYAGAVVKGPLEGLNDAVEGAYGMITHPWDTVKALVTQPIHAIKASADEFNQTQGQPLSSRIVAGTLTGLEQEPIIGNLVQQAEGGGTRMASPESIEAALRGTTSLLAPEAAGPLARGLQDTAKATRDAALRGVTKTGPSVPRALVEDTAAKNANAAAKYEAKATPIREAAQTAEQLNAAERDYKTRLADVEKRVHADADAKYAELNPQLHPLPVDMENIGTTIEHALGELDAATPEPPLLTKLRKLSENSALDYGDLDSFRKSIGSALRKGGLSGTVYHVYDTLMNGGLDEEGNAVPGIVDEMQRVASDKGLAAEADAARSSWRDWAQAFRDRKSPLQKVLADPEPHGLLKRFRDKEASGIGVLQKFDPQLASDINGSLGQMDDINAPRGRSPLPVPKVPAPPETQVLTPDDVTAAKQQQAIDTANRLRNSSSHLATVFVVIDGLRSLMKAGRSALNFQFGDAAQHIANAGVDAAGRVGYALMKNQMAKYLEDPKTVDAVGKLTPEDVQEVMKLPADQRAGFDELLNQAQARGVKMKPGVMDALFGTVKRAAQVGPKTQRLRDLQQQQAPQ